MAGNWGFIGPTYGSPSSVITSDRAMNLVPEIIEQSQGPSKSRLKFFGRPGKQLFATLPQTCRQVIAARNGNIPRMFAIGGDKIYEVGFDGVVQEDSTIENGSDVPQMFETNNNLILYDGNGNIWWRFTETTKVLENVRALAYMDGYALALRANNGEFGWGKQININRTPFIYDEWRELDFAIKQTSPDVLQTIFADHGLVWLFGKSTVEVWQHTGAEFPFERNPSGFIEQGLWAKNSVVKLDESIFFLGGDDRGPGMVWRSNGYTPKRVSNHAIERLIKSYAVADSDISDAVGMTYQEDGHNFYALHFPTADAPSLYYDTATELWHERCRWDGSDMHQEFGRFHCHQFGKHLVADYRNGKIYEASTDLYDDDGDPILWERTAPHVSDDKEWVRHNSLWVDKETHETEETMTLFMSDNGGKTFGAGRTVAVSDSEDYPGRAIWRQLGRSRDRVYKVRSTAALRQQWIDGYLKATPGMRNG